WLSPPGARTPREGAPPTAAAVAAATSEPIAPPTLGPPPTATALPLEAVADLVRRYTVRPWAARADGGLEPIGSGVSLGRGRALAGWLPRRAAGRPPRTAHRPADRRRSGRSHARPGAARRRGAGLPVRPLPGRHGAQSSGLADGCHRPDRRPGHA